MIRRLFNLLTDSIATAEAMDSDPGALPEDPLIEYEIIADTRDVHRLYTICTVITIAALFAPIIVLAWVRTH